MPARLTPLSVLLVAVLAIAAIGPLRDATAGDSGSPVDLVAKKSANPVTPGSFTGYGFDQCMTPDQAKMDAWLQHSPFLAVGVYISGNSRFCRDQPNLTPTWVAKQLAAGWRILPITLGPQSTCVGRFPRYGAKIDPTISTSSTNAYAAARKQGVNEAVTATSVAKGLGFAPGSTLWYDIEGWSNYKDAKCRESALAFLSGWTTQIRKGGYVSGVYSSAGSGMKILEDARAARRTDVTLPSQIWLARYDNAANTSARQYFSDTGWQKARVKQYQGGHDETWGGVKINIDRNYLDLGNSTPAPVAHCGGIRLDLSQYLTLRPPTTTAKPGTGQVRALKCLLTEEGYFSGNYNGTYGTGVQRAIRAWQRDHGFAESTTWTSQHWMSLLADGAFPVLKIGSRGEEVRRAQRALRAAMPSLGIVTDGVYDAQMRAQVSAYRTSIGMVKDGILNATTWRKLRTGTTR